MCRAKIFLTLPSVTTAEFASAVAGSRAVTLTIWWSAISAQNHSKKFPKATWTGASSRGHTLANARKPAWNAPSTTPLTAGGLSVALPSILLYRQKSRVPRQIRSLGETLPFKNAGEPCQHALNFAPNHGKSFCHRGRRFYWQQCR